MIIENNELIMKCITGFTNETNKFPKQEIKPFVSLIYSVLRGELEWEDLELVGKNYYWFVISSKGQEYYFFLNAYYPIAAVSKEISNDFIFLSETEIEGKFKLITESNYILLSKEKLEEEINKEDLKNLTEIEIKQYEYWKPRTLRELIFNNWD